MKEIRLKIHAALFIVLLFSSCATMINTPIVRVDMHSDTENSVKVHFYNDTLNWYTLPISVDVKRSRHDIMVTARKDTTQKQIEVKSEISTAFWLGNLFSGGILGYAIDLTNPNKYTYPKTILIELNNNDKPYSKTDYYTWLKPQKDLLTIKISVPTVNFLYLNKEYGYGNTSGFIGISAGFEYYLLDKYCLNMDFGGLTDFPFPIPVPIEWKDNYRRSFAIYGDFQIGSDYKRWHYDIGIQFTRTSYYEYLDYELKHNKIQNSIGHAFSLYNRIAKNFNIGLNYYPSFLVLENEPKFHYSHVLFFEMLFRIEAYRRQKR